MATLTDSAKKKLTIGLVAAGVICAGVAIYSATKKKNTPKALPPAKKDQTLSGVKRHNKRKSTKKSKRKTIKIH